MKVGYTHHEARVMYHAARKEAAKFYGDARILNVPVHFANFFDKWGPSAIDSMAITDFGTVDAPAPFARGIWVESTNLPYIYEDELRYLFLHELTHTSLPYTADHGPDFLERAAYLTGWDAPTLDLRNQNIVDSVQNRFSRILGINLTPDNELVTLGPIFE